jgi:RNA polymerase sigma-70 factor (ECF subfamily)
MIATQASISLNGPDPSDWTPADLRLLRDGDAAVRERFFDEYLEKVHSLVARRVANPHQVQDLVQEVFLKLHRSLNSYDPERALGPWVTTIAMNTLRDHWRAGARRELPTELTPELDPGVGDSASPSADLERREFHEGLRSAIDRLSDLSRTVLVSRAFDGEPFADISRKVGRSEVAVRKRYSRAVASLRTMLASPALS